MHVFMLCDLCIDPETSCLDTMWYRTLLFTHTHYIHRCKVMHTLTPLTFPAWCWGINFNVRRLSLPFTPPQLHPSGQLQCCFALPSANRPWPEVAVIYPLPWSLRPTSRPRRPPKPRLPALWSCPVCPSAPGAPWRLI